MHAHVVAFRVSYLPVAATSANWLCNGEQRTHAKEDLRMLALIDKDCWNVKTSVEVLMKSRNKHQGFVSVGPRRSDWVRSRNGHRDTRRAFA